MVRHPSISQSALRLQFILNLRVVGYTNFKFGGDTLDTGNSAGASGHKRVPWEEKWRPFLKMAAIC